MLCGAGGFLLLRAATRNLSVSFFLAFTFIEVVSILKFGSRRESWFDFLEDQAGSFFFYFSGLPLTRFHQELPWRTTTEGLSRWRWRHTSPSGQPSRLW